ncbi:MAG TPA: prolipoprotein diacylglyceryl transferase [Candidatus Acidoferrales bacterium]|nr:prolipoprotein diacylglyceryl transferase [Candidatus Acidoferrales bacterium]
MMPFIHIGPVTLASYGLCVGIAMLVSYFVLAKDMQRRAIHAPADMLVAVPCIAGLVGAKLYHVLETPRELFADPKILISQYGFAWFGGFLGGFIAFVLLARHYRIPLLEIFDAASPAAALGYGIGRIGCLISGDGDYGIPTSLPWGMSFPHGLVPTTQRVHPTPIYELIVAIFIFWWLWRLGQGQIRLRTTKPKRQPQKDLDDGSDMEARSLGHFLWASPGNALPGPVRRALLNGAPIPRGEVFAQYLILTGAARFLVEFIRINPRSFFGMTNAQAAALGSIIIGAALMWRDRRTTTPQDLPRKELQ